VRRHDVDKLSAADLDTARRIAGLIAADER